MKYIIFTLLLIILFNCSVNAIDLFGLKAQYSKSNQELQNSISKNMSDISAELGVIKNNQLKIRTDLKANVEATAKIVAGYDRSTSNDTRAGRDVNMVNDTGFLKALLGMLSTIVCFLIMIIFFTIKELFKSVKEKKDYKRKYYEIRNGGTV